MFLKKKIIFFPYSQSCRTALILDIFTSTGLSTHTLTEIHTGELLYHYSALLFPCSFDSCCRRTYEDVNFSQHCWHLFSMCLELICLLISIDFLHLWLHCSHFRSSYLDSTALLFSFNSEIRAIPTSVII